jgi:hypothetical protein
MNAEIISRLEQSFRQESQDDLVQRLVIALLAALGHLDETAARSKADEIAERAVTIMKELKEREK